MYCLLGSHGGLVAINHAYWPQGHMGVSVVNLNLYVEGSSLDTPAFFRYQNRLKIINIQEDTFLKG